MNVNMNWIYYTENGFLTRKADATFGFFFNEDGRKNKKFTD